MNIIALAGGESAGAAGEVGSSIAGGVTASITIGRSQVLLVGVTVGRAGDGERQCGWGGTLQQLQKRRQGELLERPQEVLPARAFASVTGEVELTTITATALLLRFSLYEQSWHLIRPISKNIQCPMRPCDP